MKYTVYQITNLINNKIYVGVHQTISLEDSYFSSSKAVKQAVQKYGRENFRKDILFVYDNPIDMFEKEKELVNEEFIGRSDTYNITCGGIGSWDHWNNGSEKHREVSKEAGKKAIKKLHKFLEENPDRRVLPPNWTGKKHSEDSKKKISQANKVNQAGEKNSHYGHVWCVKIDAFDINDRKTFHKNNIPDGWIPVTEFRDRKKKRNGAYGRKWYNDGSQNYYLLPDDARINTLNKGRIGKLFQQNSV